MREVTKMKYEMIENAIEKLNEQITRLNSRIVELTWIDKNFSNPQVKALEKKIEALLDRKYELADLIK